ncbi:MAG: beta-galactosidase trimerization domain-containing protein [Candidatus Latescibacterota bacterium]|jgi:hypothetical protein
MGRFEGTLPDDPELLAARARMIGRELHVNLEWVIGTPGLAPGLGYLTNFQSDRCEVNPALGNGDPLRTYVPLARAEGIAVFAYTNMHWFATAFADRHPGWEQVLADGSAYGRRNPLYGDGTTFCVNSPWREFACLQIEEAMKTGIDGVFLDGPVVYPGCCYCPACRERFRQQHGAELPEVEDWDDPRWPTFLRFREQSMAAFLRDAGARARQVNPEAGIFCNAGNWAFGSAVARDPWSLETVQDLTGAEAFFHLRKEGTPYLLDTSMTAKFLRAGQRPAVVFTHHMLGVWHFIGLSPLELKRAFYQSAACGAGNWFAVFDPAMTRMAEKTKAPVAEAYGFLAAHEEYYTGAESAATTALVHSQTTSFAYRSPRVGARAETFEQDLGLQVGAGQEGADPAARKRLCDALGSDEFAGIFYNLTRNHVPFDVLRDRDLAADALDRYRTLVLPNVACVSPDQAEALTAFVRRGGRLIATYETGQYDQDGRPVDGPARELLGIDRVEGAFAPADYEEYLEVSAAGAEVAPEFEAGELLPRYRLALKIRAAADAEVLAWFMAPVGRLYGRLTDRTAYPAILGRRLGQGQVWYLAGSFGESYHHFAFLEYEALLAALVGERQVVTDAPASVQIEIWRRPGQVLVHLVNNSGDMRRPLGRILPLERLTVVLPGVKARAAWTLRRTPMEWTNEQGGLSLRLALREQYDVIVVETE